MDRHLEEGFVETIETYQEGTNNSNVVLRFKGSWDTHQNHPMNAVVGLSPTAESQLIEILIARKISQGENAEEE